MNTPTESKLTVDISFDVQRYAITWTSADPTYDPALNLVPTITLFESADDDDKTGKVAILLFRPEGSTLGASYDRQRGIFYANFPLSAAANIVGLIDYYATLQFVYKDDGSHQWAQITTGPQPLDDSDEDEDSDEDSDDESDK
jgi:hypothetical protein